MNRNIVDLSVGAGAVSVPWWVQLTAGLELTYNGRRVAVDWVPLGHRVPRMEIKGLTYG